MVQKIGMFNPISMGQLKISQPKWTNVSVLQISRLGPQMPQVPQAYCILDPWEKSTTTARITTT